MSKFRQLAEDIAGDMRDLEQQADELQIEREELRREGNEVMQLHRENFRETRKGLDLMRQAIADLRGSNSRGSIDKQPSKPEGGTVPPENTFPGGKPDAGQ